MEASSLGHKLAVLPTRGSGLLIGDLLFVEQAGQGLGKKMSSGRKWGASRSAPQPSKGQAREAQGDEWTSLTLGGEPWAEAAPHTDSLFSAGRRKTCLSGSGGLGGGQQAALASVLDQGPFLGWKIRVRRAKVFLSPTAFPGLPSGKRALSALCLL